MADDKDFYIQLVQKQQASLVDLLKNILTTTEKNAANMNEATIKALADQQKIIERFTATIQAVIDRPAEVQQAQPVDLKPVIDMQDMVLTGLQALALSLQPKTWKFNVTRNSQGYIETVTAIPTIIKQ